MLNLNCVFHDMSELYVKPVNVEKFGSVTIYIRTIKNLAKKISLRTFEDNINMEKDLEKSNAKFDFYKVQTGVSDSVFSYFFEIKINEEFKEEIKEIIGSKKEISDILYYDNRGLFEGKELEKDHFYFRIFPGFKLPDWAKGAVMYQIFVERFCNGDKSNDTLQNEYFYNGYMAHKHENWDEDVSTTQDFGSFYGGDLKGVIDKLPYLKDLGIEVIYFNPIFVSPSSHKYDTQDYDHIDPHFGVIAEDGGDVLEDADKENTHASKYIKRVTSTENLTKSDALFAQLVKKAHEMGIKVIIDGVFNHCGSFNKWLDRELIYGGGAYESMDSEYRNFFDFKKKNKWPYNDSFDGWWGYNTLPKLNYEASKKLQDYILRIGRKWVSEPYNADGWRLDVAADLGHSKEFNHNFWERFRSAVKDANSGAIVIAENYGSSREWIDGTKWDSVMNYDAFMEPVTWFLTGEDKHSDEFKKGRLNNTKLFWKSMKKAIAENFDISSRQIAMNQLSNHDHSRFLTRTNMTPGRAKKAEDIKNANIGVRKDTFRIATVILMTWPGAPTLYYGDEAGLCGYTDPDNRRPYPWGHEDMELINFHKEIIRLHKQCPELKTGALCQIDDNNTKGILSYGRYNDEYASLIIVNNLDSKKEIEYDISALEIEDMKEAKIIFESNTNGYYQKNENITIDKDIIKLVLNEKSATICRIRK